MTADEFIRVASITLDEVRKAREQGADLERRRIRRDQKSARDWLRNMAAHHENGADRNQAQRFLSELDAATRAKKGKRK